MSCRQCLTEEDDEQGKGPHCSGRGNNSKFVQKYLFDSGQSFPPLFQTEEFHWPSCSFLFSSKPKLFQYPPLIGLFRRYQVYDIAKQKQPISLCLLILNHISPMNGFINDFRFFERLLKCATAIQG